MGILVVVIFVNIVAVAFFLFPYQSNSSKNSLSNSGSLTVSLSPLFTTITNMPPSRYTSDKLNVSFMIPVNYQIKEQFNTIQLKNDSDEILISRDGSLFYNVEDHLNDLAKNKFTLNNKTDLFIEGNRAINIDLISNQRTENAYFIYANDFIYVISAKQSSIKQDLQELISSLKFLD